MVTKGGKLGEGVICHQCSVREQGKSKFLVTLVKRVELETDQSNSKIKDAWIFPSTPHGPIFWKMDFTITTFNFHQIIME